MINEPTCHKGRAEKRVYITEEIEEKILKLANCDSFSKAIPKVESALNLAKMIEEQRKNGSQFYEKDKDGELFLVEFII